MLCWWYKERSDYKALDSGFGNFIGTLKMAGVQDQLEIRFRLTDGSDIGPKTFPAATSVATLKESILAQWPKGNWSVSFYHSSFRSTLHGILYLGSGVFYFCFFGGPNELSAKLYKVALPFPNLSIPSVFDSDSLG